MARWDDRQYRLGTVIRSVSPSDSGSSEAGSLWLRPWQKTAPPVLTGPRPATNGVCRTMCLLVAADRRSAGSANRRLADPVCDEVKVSLDQGIVPSTDQRITAPAGERTSCPH
jgi:hypothetical protein